MCTALTCSACSAGLHVVKRTACINILEGDCLFVALAASFAIPQMGNAQSSILLQLPEGSAFVLLACDAWDACDACDATGVTAVDFSSRNPNILAVGLHSGAIAIYDVRARQATPCMESTAETGKHSDPVWKVRHTAMIQHRISSLLVACWESINGCSVN